MMIKSVALAAVVGAACSLEEGHADSPKGDAATRATPIADTTPAVDQGIFELNGTTFKDLSNSAAAKRAAYYGAIFSKNQAKFLAPSSKGTAHEQNLSAAGSNNCLYANDLFLNYGTAPGYTPESVGNQGPGQQGWIMHSTGPGDSSRLRYDYLFNDTSTPFTHIRAWMRGAPDDGKNSYVTLRDKHCVDTSGPVGCSDEVDLVEYYGFTQKPRSEWVIYQNGNTHGNVGQGVYPAQPDPGLDPGHAVYSYTVYLERGNYIRLTVQGPDGGLLGTWDRHKSQGYVPSQPMYLYAGIWDCSSIDPDHNFCAYGPGFQGDSWFPLQGLYMFTCPTPP